MTEADTTTSEVRTDVSPQAAHLGEAGLGGVEVLVGDHVPLPEGYAFADPSSLTDPEMVELYKAAGYTDIDEARLEEQRQELTDDGLILEMTGIRSADGALVGAAGLAHNDELCEFGNLAVDSRHRKLGLGKALIEERLAIADQHGWKAFIPPLEATNNLGAYYEERGFVKDEELGFYNRPAVSEQVERVEVVAPVGR